MLTDSTKSNVELLHERARLQADLLTVSKREAATIARHDEKMETAEARIAELEAIIADPVAVHANMLRGMIAKPSVANIIHLYGDELRATLTGGKADAE
jgi:hypothetical protein